MKQLPASVIRMLTSRRPMPLPPEPSGPDIFWGDGVTHTHERRGIIRPMDELPRVYASADEIPPPVDEQDNLGNTPISLNTGCPPWLCPPMWSVALDFPAVACIPWYMVKTLLGTLNIPKGYLLAIKSVSYEAANAVQGDVVGFEVFVNGEQRAQWEDMVVDAAQPNPAHKFGLCGHIREMPLHIVVPVDSTVTVAATLMGAIDFNGVSPNWPGQPILTADCHVRMIFNGWYFPAMDNVQGGIRQASMGDMGNRMLDGGA